VIDKCAMAFDPNKLSSTLVSVALACACASGRATPPVPEPEADCRQTSPNLIHVLNAPGPAASHDGYEFCVSHDGGLFFERGSAPAHRGRLSSEQMQSLKTLLERASQRQSQEIAHSCTHARSLLVEWTWSGKSFAAHEACDDTQPVLASELRDDTWRLLRLDSVKVRKK
jgi:hypothetical protein